MKFPRYTLAACLLAATAQGFVVGPPAALTTTPTTTAANSIFALQASVADETNQKKPKITKLADSSTVELEIPIPGSATKAAYDKICTQLSKSIQIPGFRKGSKIPPAVLEQNMAAKGGRNAIRVQAINELVGQLVEPALKAENLDPIGQATLPIPAETLAETFQPGEDLTITVRCDVWPELEWKGSYKGLTGSYTRKPFDQSKLDKALEDLKERYATTQPIGMEGYQLQMGDACSVNMEGYMGNADGTKGEPLPNAASGDNVEVILGPGRYMEGLVEGLVGATVGETRTVSVAFPEKLRDKALAGKKAIFDVQVLSASTRTVPELTDEFAAQVKAGLTKDSLLAELRKAIDEEDAKEFRPARNKALSVALADVVEVTVPDTLVTNQAREKFAVMMADMRDNGVSDAEIKRQINPKNFNTYKEIVQDDIIRDFKVSMATDEIARLEGISVPDYQVEEQMQAIQKDVQKGEEYDENMIRARVQTTLERQAVMDWLAEQSNLEVIEKAEEAFDAELMEKLAKESLEREEKMKGGAAVVDAEVEEAPTVVVAEEEAPVAEAVAEAEAPVAEAVVEDEAPVAEAVVEDEAPVAEAVVEDEAPVADEPVAEVVEPEEPAKPMTLQEKAYQALLDAGALSPNEDPNSPDYDHSKDDEFVS